MIKLHKTWFLMNIISILLSLHDLFEYKFSRPIICVNNTATVTRHGSEMWGKCNKLIVIYQCV